MRYRLDIEPQEGRTTLQLRTGTPGIPGLSAAVGGGRMVFPAGFTLELTAEGARMLDPEGKSLPVVLLAVAPPLT